MRNNSGNHKGFSWLSKAIALLFLLILVIFGYIFYKETTKKKQINKEIATLKKEAAQIEKENMEIEERISYFSSQDYKEMEAKDKLNLQKPDENMVLVTPGPSKKIHISEEKRNETYEEKPAIPIYQKWINYFFKK